MVNPSSCNSYCASQQPDPKGNPTLKCVGQWEASDSECQTGARVQQSCDTEVDGASTICECAAIIISDNQAIASC